AITVGKTLNQAYSSLGLPGPATVPVSQAYWPLSAVPSLGITSTLSVAVICKAIPHWRRFERQFVACARCLALESAGNRSAARIAMMAITTSNSISVKPRGGWEFFRFAATHEAL